MSTQGIYSSASKTNKLWKQTTLLDQFQTNDAEWKETDKQRVVHTIRSCLCRASEYVAWSLVTTARGGGGSRLQRVIKKLQKGRCVLIFIVVKIPHVYIWPKTQTVHFKCVKFIVVKLYLDKPCFKKLVFSSILYVVCFFAYFYTPAFEGFEIIRSH